MWSRWLVRTSILGALLGLAFASTSEASQPRSASPEVAMEAPALGDASVHGVITSHSSGFSLPRVSVTLRSTTDDSFVRRGATDRAGAFRFENLPAGLYSLEASYAGYQRVTLAPFMVLDGVERKQPLSLRKLAHPVPRLPQS